MKYSGRFLFLSLFCTGALAFSLGWFGAKNAVLEIPSAAPGNTGKNAESPDPPMAKIRIRDIDEVWTRLQEDYYDPRKLELTELEWGAVKGFVESIGDPYTVFMTPEESKNFEDGLEGNLQGIGAELEIKNSQLIVRSPIKKSPAEEAGLRPGDIIYKINSQLAEEMTFFEAIQRIRGQAGTKVKLTIIREGHSEPLELTITRREIQIESLELKKLESNIWHLAIYQFSEHSKKEFENAVQRILLERGKGLILDLRGNGGGYLDISVDILSELLPKKSTAAIIKKKPPQENEIIKTDGSARLADIPLVVLVDRGSASASEILAGAIQDHKRGVVIGETTFGKGSVQELSDLPDGSELRMTIAKWFTPNDRTIDEKGITPDKEIKNTEEDEKTKRDPQLQEAIKYLLK